MSTDFLAYNEISLGGWTTLNDLDENAASCLGREWAVPLAHGDGGRAERGPPPWPAVPAGWPHCSSC